MRFGVVVFPGTWSDGDCYHVLKNLLNQDVEYLWHREQNLSSYDCVILPGGFSYGDYLRAGAIARYSPVMTAVERFAAKGGLVIGICNGFQVLCEAGLLPGALMRNVSLQFRCQWTYVKVENSNTAFTGNCDSGQVIHIPISHGEGNYHADENTLRELENKGRVLFRYCSPMGQVTLESNPNGSFKNVAGIINSDGNVLGMMPHPERCCENIVGGTDGLYIFQSVIRSLVGD